MHKIVCPASKEDIAPTRAGEYEIAQIQQPVDQAMVIRGLW
jgi:hypothetical protein